MPRQSFHSIGFNRHVTQEFIAGKGCHLMGLPRATFYDGPAAPGGGGERAAKPAGARRVAPPGFFGGILPQREPRPCAELALSAKRLSAAVQEDTDDDQGPQDHQWQGGLPIAI